MSVDLHERLHTAVGEPGPHPFDLDDAWTRGRRRRTGRRLAGVTASAVAAVAVGLAVPPEGSNWAKSSELSDSGRLEVGHDLGAPG